MSSVRSDKARPPFLRENLPFYILIAGAFAFLTIPRMAQPGMFVDGLTYAAISRNLAEGIGRFWFPFYTSTLYPQFHEHPPLGFALQAGAFAIFGDHLVVERMYAIVIGIVTGLLMMCIWRRAMRDTRYDWMPIVFWLLPSTVTWSIVNNMLETTQTAFTTMAVLAFVHSLQSAKAWVWGLVSGLSILGGVLTKGPTGFFPLAAPFVAAVLLGSGLKQALRTVATMLTPLVCGGALIYWLPEPRQGFTVYWAEQVVASVNGSRGGGRWSSLARHLGSVLLRMGALTGLAGSYGWMRNEAKRMRPSAWSWFFLALGLAGSVPLAFSARIMGHYLVPSMPLFALGFASLLLPYIRPALERWRGHKGAMRLVASAGVLLLVSSAAVPALWGPMEPRDVDRVNDYRRLAATVPRASTLGTCGTTTSDWALHAYMMRFFQVSLDSEQAIRHRYYLQLTDRECEAPGACRSIATTDHFLLLDCQPQQK